MEELKKHNFLIHGGCDIGSRPIDLHLKSFRELGIIVNESNIQIDCFADCIKGKKINLDFPSVGATENIILASVLADGETIILNAAMEPEIEDLQNVLNRMGAKVTGAGSNIIKIEGVKKLKDVSYHIMPDRIEAGSYLAMAAMSGGKIKLNNVNLEHMEPILYRFKEIGCKLNTMKNSIEMIAPKKLIASDIKTLPHPRISNRYAINLWNYDDNGKRNFYYCRKYI